MNREDLQNEVIDLGAVSAETKGVPIGFREDQEGLYKSATGLADD